MLDEHLGYVADPARIEQFTAAIAKTVKVGDKVADLGCGSGILGLLSLQAGASRVIAIDDSAMIDIARDSLLRAGHGQRASFIRGKSKQIELPERVDVVICDHVGYFGFDYGIIDFLDDARRRFLKPAGVLIPSSIRLNVAAVGSQQCHDMASGWQAPNVPEAFHWLHGYAVNTKHAVNLVQGDVLGSPAVLGEIDLYADHPDFYSWDVELSVDRDGPMHGLAGWFECKLAEGVWMTNSPLSEKPIKRPQAFLPIGETVQVKAGDTIKSTVSARPVDNLIAWVVEFPSTGQRYSHSTWQGMLLSPERLIQAKPNHVPQLSREGQAQMMVLGYCDGKRTAQEIGRAVLRDHPDLFPSSSEISNFVLRVLARGTK
jgi:SAM-dependent methyltransferase